VNLVTSASASDLCKRIALNGFTVVGMLFALILLMYTFFNRLTDCVSQQCVGAWNGLDLQTGPG